jgi:uncharacterized OsmC-like protein/alpha/beta superfamily hydrolase
MQFQKLRFQNAEGRWLAARLDLPIDEKPHAYAIFAHCFTCTKNINAIVNISRALTGQGIAVLRFDFTGLGESEGNFAETSFSTNVSDLVLAAEFLTKNFEAPALLIGHSLGGAAVLQAASSIPSVRAVATIGAPAHASDVLKHLGNSLQVLKEGGEAAVDIGGRPFTIKHQFVDDLQRDGLEESIHGLRKPLLIFHSPVDEIVSIDNAAEIFRAARHPKSFISLDHADHLLSKREDSLYAGSVLAAWAKRYLDAAPKESAAGEILDGEVVARTGKVGFRTEIDAGGHHLVADEPIAVGGSGTGPNPYDFLLSALGACTGMTLRMYADRKKWPLDAVSVWLKHGKIHAEDCDNCGSDGGNIDFIQREIELDGELDPDQKQRLLAIAERCPVHRTLQASTRIATKLKE